MTIKVLNIICYYWTAYSDIIDRNWYWRFILS